MRYRKVKKSAFLGNNDNSCVGRLIYAKEIFRLLEQGTRLICFDESWLPVYDYRPMKWRYPGDTNSVGVAKLSKRVTIFAAVDTLGNVYQSIS